VIKRLAAQYGLEVSIREIGINATFKSQEPSSPPKYSESSSKNGHAYGEPVSTG
jgi:hypothetical protein